MEASDKGKWHVKTRLEKYKGDFKDSHEVEAKGIEPYEVIEAEGNLLLNEGINALWTLTCGGSETVFNNANARIGVGDSNVAADPAQTGLQGTNTAFAGMDSGYPTFGTAQKAVFKSTFGGAVANFAWNEWTVDNGATANKNLNRKVQSFGTKTSGETWILTVELSIS